MDDLAKLTLEAEKQFHALIGTLREIEGLTCKMCNDTPTQGLMMTNALVTESLGLVYQGKGVATQAGAHSPGPSPRFGGK